MTDYTYKPILITGAARSGTSMTAGVVDIGGGFGGETCGATRWNKRGQFENLAIRQGLTKPFLASIGCDPMGQWPLPDLENLEVRKKLRDAAPWMRDEMVSIIQSQGVKPEQRWYYKGAKMCLLWPLYQAAFPEADWVIARRDDEAIISSCLKTGFMRAFDTAEGWRKWLEVHKTRFAEMFSVGLRLIEIWPQAAIEGDLTQYRFMTAWLGLDWKKSRVIDFISPALWNNRGGA